MEKVRRGFGSDNHSGVHPILFEAIAAANRGHAPSYGTDEWTRTAQTLFQTHFGEKAETFFVFNGTAANVLSLSAMMKSYESAFCADSSHLQMDECAAPEFFTRGKLRLLPTQDGKVRVEDLKANLIRRGDQHYSQPRVLSLTQPTELGTCYALNDFRTLIQTAHQEGLWVHVDGARLMQAASFLKLSLKELITESGVDVLSFGGTKNGFLFGEAIVILRPELAKNFQYLRKQAAQLPSKTRFVSAQFVSYLQSGLCFELALRQHQLALELAGLLKEIPGLQITRPVESNAVFVQIPKNWIKPLREHSFFYVWDEKTFECRLMISWDTTTEDLQNFATLCQELS